jgi:TrmH family RNA methyltransferase
MHKTITSLQNDYIKQLKALALQKGDLADEFFLVEGKHSVLEAFEAGYLVEVIVINPDLSFPDSLTQILVPPYILDAISTQKSPQGMIGLCKKNPPGQLQFNATTFYLDKINDPGNLGTIFRTALALGFKQFILAKGSVNPYHPKVIASTQGAIFKLAIFIDDTDSLLNQFKSRHIPILGTTLHEKASSVETFQFKQPSIILFGNESHGIQKHHLALCDHYVMIPITNIESLNVAIAFGIIAFTISKSTFL